MINDLFLIIGCSVLVLAIPAIFSAFTEGRTPRAAAILIMIGGGLVVTAATQHPGGYKIKDLPDVLERVINHYL